jgi:hypothetical protein
MWLYIGSMVAADESRPVPARALRHSKIGKSCWFPMPNEWFYIQQTKRKDEQNRDVGRNRIRFNNDGFTPADIVPIVLVNDEEDDFGEEKE